MHNPQLETFICVVEAGSFNKAAEKMYISPPAVIKQINLSGESIGTSFVHSHASGTGIDEGGTIFVPGCQVCSAVLQGFRVREPEMPCRKSTNVIRIGTSPMTPAQVLVDLWPRVQEYCPNVKFQLVPFENTPENAREILANLGQHIDVVAGIFDKTMLHLRQCAGLYISREPICCAVSVPSSFGPEGAAVSTGSVWRGPDADAAGLESLRRSSAG